MSLVVFDKPVHPALWLRPAGSLDYRVTGSFYGVDLVNGGIHQATDVGNGQTGHPVLAPADRRARGLRNYSRNGTDALGLEFALGGGYRLELWHLSQTLPVPDENKPAGQNSYGSWRDVRRDEVVGRTGNSGALVGGKAMPAHTHIRLTLNGVPIDPEPYLLGLATLPGLQVESRLERLARERDELRAKKPISAGKWDDWTHLTPAVVGQPLASGNRKSAELMFHRAGDPVGAVQWAEWTGLTSEADNKPVDAEQLVAGEVMFLRRASE